MSSILIVEDERSIRELIRMTMEQAGHSCVTAQDGRQAADLIEQRDFDLALLDIMLPFIDGYELLEYLKSLHIPVIFLTARGELADRVRGLRMGADDYLVKPFEPEELAARVYSVLRRAGKAAENLTVGDVTLDVENRRCIKSGKTVSLTPRETDLLILLMQNAGKTLYREYLYETIWGQMWDEADNRALDTHIQRLRRKLGWEKQIRTLYKVGYRLEK